MPHGVATVYGRQSRFLASFSGGKDSCVLRHLVHQVQDELNLKHSKYLIAAEFFHPETAKFLKNNTSKDDILVAPKKT